MADGKGAAWGEGQMGGSGPDFVSDLGPDLVTAPSPDPPAPLRLPELAAALGLPAAGLPDVAVRGVAHNADWLRPGELFVAIRGARFDGHRFIDRAAQRGAVAVLGEGPGGRTRPCPTSQCRTPARR